jgi:hypothetical protein
MKTPDLIEQGRFLGEEFILWLWMKGQRDGGASGAEGDASSCHLDDAVELVNERGDVRELSLRKGNPSESREAFEALARGMRPLSAKVRIQNAGAMWVFTLKAATLDTGAMKLPPGGGEAQEHARAMDRLLLIEECLEHLERRYRVFLEARTEAPEAMQEELHTWIRRGRSGEVGAADEVPWEE